MSAPIQSAPWLGCTRVLREHTAVPKGHGGLHSPHRENTKWASCSMSWVFDPDKPGPWQRIFSPFAPVCSAGHAALGSYQNYNRWQSVVGLDILVQIQNEHYKTHLSCWARQRRLSLLSKCFRDGFSPMKRKIMVSLVLKLCNLGQRDDLIVRVTFDVMSNSLSS